METFFSSGRKTSDHFLKLTEFTWHFKKIHFLHNLNGRVMNLFISSFESYLKIQDIVNYFHFFPMSLFQLPILAIIYFSS